MSTNHTLGQADAPAIPLGLDPASAVELLQRLALAVAQHVSPVVPVSVALWDIATIATYLHRSEQHTRQWIVTMDGFPRPIRIPSGKVTSTERARPLWRSKDVIEWAESHVAA
ncbi:hypothetical protein PAP18089_01888 [Pandoraea apista]|uniref:Uncharacterized protein n=1 Tax=Pandoraea apista TaxID=93218 RepID=A0A5E5P2J1_9BURK|nr:hypothetical protein [Pandoraea apista]VVG70916.1 hypothetical protein PAP18089_01888 [Pandoraea apista]